MDECGVDGELLTGKTCMGSCGRNVVCRIG